MKKRRVERDNLRERERQARAQMSSQANSEQQEAVPMFRPPVRVSPAASDPVTQQIQKKLGDYAYMKQFLDDPKASIGVYGEPASPAPGGGHMRGVEFKKPHHTSSQNGRPQNRIPHYAKISDGHHLSSTIHNRPALPRLYNGKTPPSVGDPNGVPAIENILKEMASTAVQPLTAIAATPRKEMESKFNFNINFQKANESHSKISVIPEPKPAPQPKQYLDSSSIPAELEKDLSLSDSDDESRKRKPPVARMTSAGGSTSGSESSSTDTDSDSTSDDDSKPRGARTPLESPSPEVDEQPEVVEGPGEPAAPPHNRSSWLLSNFVPPPAVSSAASFNVDRPSGSSPRSGSTGRASPPFRGGQRPSPARSHPRASPRGSLKGSGNISSTAPGSNTSASSNISNTTVESDSCYDSTKEVETVLAEAKGKTESLLSGLSDSDDGMYSEISRRAPGRPQVPGSGSDRGASFRGSAGRTARRSPRTPVGPRPRSSPSASEDEAPSRPPRPDQERRRRGRPPKTAERGPPAEGPPREEDSVKRRRGRPPKAKPPVRPPSPASLSDDDRPDSSPAAPVQRWHSTDESEGECATAAAVTDKKKNDTLRKLFSAVGAGKGGGKGGAKGGKGKGQVMVIEAHSISEHEKEDETAQRRLKEEEAHRKLREEEAQRRLKEEEAQRRAEEEAAALQKAREEAERKKLREEMQRKLAEEALRRKIKDEEALQKRREKEEAAKRQKEEEAQRRQREETAQRRIRENELAAQRRLKEEEMRKVKEEELRHLRFKEEEDALQKRLKEEEQPILRRIKDEETASRRSRDEATSQRRSRNEEVPSEVTGVNVQVMVRVDLWRLSESCLGRLRRARPLKRPPPPPPAPPDKRPKLARQNPETTPTNHERVENHPPRSGQTPIFYSYLEKGHQDCSSDEESRDHKYYLSEAKRLRAAAESESDPLGRVMLYQESVLCFVLTGRVLELELDTKKAFTMYQETMEYIKSIQSMPARYRLDTKLDILSLRCQALLYLRMHKMYRGEVKEYYKTYQDYVKPTCPEAVGTVSPLSPTPSPAGSVGSVGSGGSSSGYGSAAPTLTPQHTPSAAAACSSSLAPASSTVSVPVAAHTALLYLTKYYSFLCVAHEFWDQADSLIVSHQYTDLFVSVDRVCGPLTLHSSFRHLVKYVRYAISLLKSQERHAT